MNTRTSKKARSKGPPQKPFAATSSLAPSSVMAEAPESASPVMGCSVGSMDTLLQTSEMRLAVRSLTSLCRMVGNPPLGQDSACSTEKLVPHVQVVGVCWGSQPYLRAMASLKVPLWREKPNSSRGREVSQLEAPFSCVRSMARWRGAEMVALSVVAELFAHLRFCLWAALLAWIWASRHWKGYSASWLRMRSFRGADTSTEAWYSVFGRSVGLTISRDPPVSLAMRGAHARSHLEVVFQLRQGLAGGECGPRGVVE